MGIETYILDDIKNKISGQSNFTELQDTVHFLCSITQNVRLKEFVANRVAQIQKWLSPERWFHISSQHNLADCASHDEKGLLRVGGRLKHTDLPYQENHPILLPRSHHVMAPITVEHSARTVNIDNLFGNKCRICSKGVKKGIRCDKCLRWIHGKCIQVNTNEIPEDRFWSCPECAAEEKDAIFEREISSKDKVIETLLQDIAVLREKNNELEREKSDLKEELSSLKESAGFSTIVRRKTVPANSTLNVLPPVSTLNSFNVLQTPGNYEKADPVKCYNRVNVRFIFAFAARWRQRLLARGSGQLYRLILMLLLFFVMATDKHQSAGST
ncbi:hypothetical protein J437_LFUL018825 [Ladona fulva]|uniref:PHD-type domain-containing protein n=1 Tax=Ladona fulva TaxID=123851 RepID=A0A8K0P9Q9_LADFU|nr:hypothetical protein J437_LFUL018825 [Ladona fulva]